MSFERGPVTGIPAGWKVYPENEGASAGTLEEDALSGVRSGYVQCSGDNGPEDYAYLYQWLSASGMTGKRYAFRGSLRMDGKNIGKGACLRVRVVMADGTETTVRALDPNVKGDEWENQLLVFDVPEEAESIMLSVLIEGPSKARIDDLSLESLGVAGGLVQPPMALDDNERTNLLAFARLLGYVRHFHPSDEVEDADWDAIAIDGVRRLAGVEGPEALATALGRIFVPLGPTIQIFPTGSPVEPNIVSTRPEGGGALRVYSLEQRGYARAKGVPYSRVRKKRSERKAQLPAEIYERELPGGVTCRVPLAVWGNYKRSYPAAKKPLRRPAVTANVMDRGTRLAAIILAWNVLQHFYPYFDVTTTPWEGALESALDKAATDSASVEFYRTLQQLVARLDDVHAVIGHSGEPELSAILPLTLGWVENLVIVTGVDEDTPEPRPQVGDELLAIDGVPVADLMAYHALHRSAASDRVRRDRSLIHMLISADGGSADLLLESPGGGVRELTLDYKTEVFTGVKQRQRIEEVEPGILYVDVSRLDVDTIELDVKRIQEARGIVFDLRGYPNVPYVMAQFLTEEPLESPLWRVPVLPRPDREGLRWEDSSWTLPPANSYFPGKAAFLISSIAQSAAETNLSFVEAYELAELVGEPTAGTNGNVIVFPVLGGYTISFTGMRVLKQDGSEHHGIGIEPTIPVSRTRQGVIDGRDEQLGRAIEVVKQPAESALARGDFHLGFMEFEAAVVEYSAGIDQKPNDVELRQQRGIAYFNLSEFELALQDLEVVETFADGEFKIGASSWYLERGVLQWAAGDLSAAAEDYELACELAPEEAAPVECLARLAYSQNQFDVAVAYIERSSKLANRSDWEMRYLTWMAERRMGDTSADAKLRAHVDVRRNSYFDLLARVLLGDVTEDQFFDEAAGTVHLEYADVLVHLYFSLGTLCLFEGRHADAREYFELCDPQVIGFLPVTWMAKMELDRLN